MEWQVGQVNLRLHISLDRMRATVTLIYPLKGNTMECTKVYINNHPDEPINIESFEYERGDKHAEKSAIS